MASRCVTLELTSEQEDVIIKQIFVHYNWVYKETEPEKAKGKKRPGPKKATVAPAIQHVPNPAPDGEGDAGENPLNDDDGECQYCFLSPCVTTMHYAWLGTGQDACFENSSIRKEKYSNYWKVLTNLGAWSDPRYLRVKRDRDDGGEWAGTHIREVMPVCILKQLRTLHPNPMDKPYMDHRWE